MLIDDFLERDCEWLKLLRRLVYGLLHEGSRAELKRRSEDWVLVAYRLQLFAVIDCYLLLLIHLNCSFVHSFAFLSSLMRLKRG